MMGDSLSPLMWLIHSHLFFIEGKVQCGKYPLPSINIQKGMENTKLNQGRNMKDRKICVMKLTMPMRFSESLLK